MNQTQIDARITELRAKYPKMFSHPHARPGEICLGPAPFTAQAAILYSKGLRSVREVNCGDETKVRVSSGGGWAKRDKLECMTIFADLREYVEYTHGLQQHGLERKKIPWWRKIFRKQK